MGWYGDLVLTASLTAAILSRWKEEGSTQDGSWYLHPLAAFEKRRKRWNTLCWVEAEFTSRALLLAL